jgi:P27 family predicted phage terminase small subunit
VIEHREPPEPPAGLKIMPGTATKRAERAWVAPARPQADSIETPYTMSDEAAAVWAEVTADLASMGLLQAADRRQIAAYCEATVTAEKCTNMINRSSLLVKGSKKETLVPNKLLAIRRDAWATQLRLAQEFGLSPAGRTRVDTGHPLISPKRSGSNPFDGSSLRQPPA